MAASWPRVLLLRAVALLLLSGWCAAKTVTYNFNVSWVTGNPDGMTERKVIGINGKWPLPVIEVNKGDQLVVHMHNGLGDRAATIHWHGMYQNGTNEMDGPSMITQCPVPPGADFTYNFTVNQNGTYWYHCHTEFCYPDGYRQALIVHDTNAYFEDQYEEELVVTMSDWYHELIEDIRFLSLYNPTGAEPFPDSFLFNDTQNASIPVKPGTTYLLRLINIGAFMSHYFYIEGHNFTIVEIDGVYTEPAVADTLYIAVAQRYSVLLTTKNETDKNYAMVMVADSELLDGIPSQLQLNQTNWLEYNKDTPHDVAEMTVETSADLVAFDDFTLIPYDREPLLPEPDYEIVTAVKMEVLKNGKGYALLDNISYTTPKVPTLFTALSSGNLATDPKVYGDYTHSFVLEHNQVCQIVVNNDDGGTHPFHLHGHNFQVIQRAPAYGETFYDFADLAEPVPFDPSNHSAFPSYPARRDVFVLPPQGYIVIRFVADNPGVWQFHCHIDWHLYQGLAMLLIEAPQQIKERIKIPQQHYDVCRQAGISTVGNAAGNAANYLDLTGQNKQQGFLPSGFTQKGVVALALSIINGCLGVIFITIYGLSDPVIGKK